MTKNQFEKELKPFLKNYGQKVDGSVLKIWFAIFQKNQITVEEFKRALLKILSTVLDWYPGTGFPAHVLDVVNNERKQIKKDQNNINRLEELRTWKETSLKNKETGLKHVSEFLKRKGWAND
jgi:hypothetical protein